MSSKATVQAWEDQYAAASVLLAHLGSKNSLQMMRIFYRLDPTISKGSKQFKISGLMFQNIITTRNLKL